jgi:hypothetical protein
MRFIRDWVQRRATDFLTRKLSASLGRAVTFQSLQLSFSTLELTGITVATDRPGELPPLTIARVRAQVSTGKMLSKQIAVRSLVIEDPVITVIRRADGSINLPSIASTAPVQNGMPTRPNVSDDDAESTTWTLEAAQILVTNGQIHYREESSAYHASAEQLQIDIRQTDPLDTDVTLYIPSLGRRDVPVPLSPLQLRGRFIGVRDMTQLATAPLSASAEVESIKLDVGTTNLSSLDVSLAFTGKVVLSKLATLLPSRFVPAIALTSGFTGTADVTGQARWNPAGGLRVSSFMLSAHDLTIPAANVAPSIPRVP